MGQVGWVYVYKATTFYWLFNESNIALMITNAYSTPIEWAKVAYHWKTGQKTTLLPTTCPKQKFDAPNERVLCIRIKALTQLDCYFIEYLIKITYYWCSNVQNTFYWSNCANYLRWSWIRCWEQWLRVRRQNHWWQKPIVIKYIMTINGWSCAKWIVQSYKHTNILILSGFSVVCIDLRSSNQTRLFCLESNIGEREIGDWQTIFLIKLRFKTAEWQKNEDSKSHFCLAFWLHWTSNQSTHSIRE